MYNRFIRPRNRLYTSAAAAAPAPALNPATRLEEEIQKVNEARERVRDIQDDIGSYQRKISAGIARRIAGVTPEEQLNRLQQRLNRELANLAVAEVAERVIRSEIINELRGIFNEQELTKILSAFAGVPVRR